MVKLVKGASFDEAVHWLAAQTREHRQAPTKYRYRKFRTVTGRKAVVRFWNKEKWYSAIVGLDTDLLKPARALERNHPVPELEEEPILDEGAVPEVLEGYLDGCRPLEGQLLDYLVNRGIASEVVQHLMIRFCGKEYEDLMNHLESRFGKGALVSAGLLSRGKKGYYPTFGPYFWKQVGFLVIPYLRDGKPVYLKARPPIDKATAKSKGVVRFLNTGRAVPCPYNVDAIKGAGQILICEGETDTMTALTHGYAAVGVPCWSHFKTEWVELFKGKKVFLVLDADTAGASGVREIARKFDKAGLPLPRQVTLPAGQDLNEFFKDGEEL